jgi:hypothetical protein
MLLCVISMFIYACENIMLLCVISMFIYACECIWLQHCDYDVHVLNYALSNTWFD